MIRLRLKRDLDVVVFVFCDTLDPTPVSVTDYFDAIG